jgi:hypothetical protein
MNKIYVAILLVLLCSSPTFAQMLASGGAATNITQVGGTNLTLGQKAMTASIPVVIASDQSSLGVTVSGTLSSNVAQVGGNTVSTGNGTTGTGSQRVTIASDNTPFGVIAYPKNACGTTAVSVAWVAVPTVAAAPSGFSTTSCLKAIIFTNTNAGGQTVTVTDGQGSPVTMVATLSIPGNSTAIIPMYETQATTGIKWVAGGTGVTGSVVGWQ